MMRSDDRWDLVPVRLILASLAVAGLFALVGFYAAPFNALAVVVYGSVAIGLTLYGFVGSVAETFKEGVWHGVACLLFPPFYAIYFYATHPASGWKSFVNMVLGFGLMWVALQLFPMFRHADARPAQSPFVGGDALEKLGPGHNDVPLSGAEHLTATTIALANLLESVTDESTARKAAPRFRQLMAQRRSDLEASGEPRALNDRGQLVSISAVTKLGPRFRDANRQFEKRWKRVRLQAGISEVLEGSR
jgi:hypothetical protein